ncbi:MAG: hypothetical protein V2G42_06560 [bacterium JZ-2024 1]
MSRARSVIGLALVTLQWVDPAHLNATWVLWAVTCTTLFVYLSITRNERSLEV